MHQSPQLLLITFEPLKLDDLQYVHECEQDEIVAEFIVATSFSEHERNLVNPKLRYLKILANGKVVGYLILKLDDDGVSVELRRIVIAKRGQGAGQSAMTAFEGYCGDTLQRRRIWLDAFSHNTIARHVYEKAGYQEFGGYHIDGKPLILYEKNI